jgi:hypothetical protein
VRARAQAVARASAFAIAVSLTLTSANARAEPGETRACIDSATRGQKLRGAGKLRAARDAFLACAATECPALVRQDCSTWLEEVTTETPSVVLGARDANGKDLTRVRAFANDVLLASALDGRTYPLDPGSYRFRFEREDGTVAFVDVVLRTKESARNVVVTFLPTRDEPTVVTLPISERAGLAPTSAPSSSSRTVVIAALGGGALLSAVGVVVFGLRARGDVSDLRGSCSPKCNSDEERALHTDLFLANVAVGVGVASLASLVLALVWPRAPTRPATSMTIAPLSAGMGASLRVPF